MALDHRRRAPATRSTSCSDSWSRRRTEERADGPQDPVRHDRPAALRHARLQRRHARPHAGGRRARRRRASATSGRIPQSVVCMPSRSTMLTGQHPSTHGVWMNGVPLPVDAPSVAADAARRRLPHRARSARRTSSRSSTRSAASPRTGRALGRGDAARPLGRRHRRAAPRLRAPRVRDARRRRAAALRAVARRATIPRRSAMFYPVLDGDFEVNAAGGGDTGAPQVKDNPIPRDWYHTDWVADRTIAWLDSLDADDDWFCWMSFPDPHHPWDPPAVGDGPRRLARRAAARRLPESTRRERERDPRRQAAPLAALVRRHARVQLRGADATGCRRRSPPIRCARSTPATRSSAS